VAALTRSIIHPGDHAARRLQQSLIVDSGVKCGGDVEHAISRGNTTTAATAVEVSFCVDVGICR